MGRGRRGGVTGGVFLRSSTQSAQHTVTIYPVYVGYEANTHGEITGRNSGTRASCRARLRVSGPPVMGVTEGVPNLKTRHSES